MPLPSWEKSNGTVVQCMASKYGVESADGMNGVDTTVTLPSQVETETRMAEKEHLIEAQEPEKTSEEDFAATGDLVAEFQAVVKDAQQKKQWSGKRWSANAYKDSTRFDYNLGLVFSATSSSKDTGISNAMSTEARKEKFGENFMAPPDPKSLFALMAEAMEDPTLIVLTIAAIVQLILGIAFHNEDDAAPGWIEGVAILVTVAVVVVNS